MSRRGRLRMEPRRSTSCYTDAVAEEWSEVSEAFQCIVFEDGAEVSDQSWCAVPGSLFVRVSGRFWAASPPNTSHLSFDAEVGAQLASVASARHGAALHVVYDSSTGTRYSRVFRAGGAV